MNPLQTRERKSWKKGDDASGGGEGARNMLETPQRRKGGR